VTIYVIQRGQTVYAVGRSANAAWRAFGGWSKPASVIVASYYPLGYRVREYEQTPKWVKQFRSAMREQQAI